jgi:NAD(P)-dependent dehydrogenase (short-subunit alcohol dehydrogenase family)
MRELSGKVALVTGAASGIGQATALALAQRGCRLVLTDIAEKPLAQVAAEVASASDCLLARTADVSNKEQMAGLADQVHSMVPAIDILVNNAGVYVVGGLLDLSVQDWEWCLSVNLWGVIHTAHCFVPAMAKRGQGGHVVNLSSMYGYWAAPGVIGYLTSKFGVFGFSQSLRAELKPAGIGVSTVCPGVVRTGLVQHMRLKRPGAGEETRERLEKVYQRRNFGPDKVASAIVKAIERNRGLVLVAPESKVMYVIDRLCPPLSRLIASRSVKRMFS